MEVENQLPDNLINSLNLFAQPNRGKQQQCINTLQSCIKIVKYNKSNNKESTFNRGATEGVKNNYVSCLFLLYDYMFLSPVNKMHIF